MKKYFLIFVLSLVLTIATRFYLLGKVPAGLYLDEAAQGYNAYSILTTGRDEFGMPFPAAFRSFTDFKTPVYIYLIAPLIPLFGLTAFTVRFPSFLASILTLPILFLLIKKLSPKPLGSFVAAASCLLLAISPWHILFGRTNFECNVALFFFLSGIYLFYLGLGKPILLVLSGIVLAVAAPAYHSERLLVPLTAIYFLVRFHKQLFDKTHRSPIFFGAVLAFLISLPTLMIVNTPGFLSRFNTLTVNVKDVAGFLSDYQGSFGWLVNNSGYLRIKDFLALYFSYFSPRNLFFLGDYGGRSSFPELSTFFFWQLPFYLHGLYLIIRKKEYGELRNLTLFLLVFSPLPAALTRDPFSTIRALPLVIPIIILISVSFWELWQKLEKKSARLTALGFAVLVLIYSLVKLYSSVIVLNEYFRASYWNYGLEQVVEILNSKTDPNLPVVIDNARGEQYSQVLFYTKYDPATYQKNNFEVSEKEYYTNLNRNSQKKIGRITVKGISWKPDTSLSQYLVGDYLAISEEQLVRNHLELIGVVKYPDGSPAYRVVKTHPELNSVTIK